MRTLRFITLDPRSFSFILLNKLCFCAIIMFSIFGCGRNENEEDSSPAFIWDCSGQIIESSVPVDNIFSSIKILGLEETDKSLIGSISKVISCDDSLYLILDSKLSKKMFLFNSKNGAFVRTFGETGNGPGEYTSIEDVTYDKAKDLIYALCDNKRIITYDLNGNIKNENNLGFNAYALEFLGDRFYTLTHDENMGELVVMDNDLKVINNYFNNSENELPHQLVHGLVKGDNAELLFIRYLDNNIYNIDDSQQLKVKYQIDFGEKALTREDAAGKSTQEYKALLETKRGSIKYFIENNDVASIVFFDGQMPCISILNKNDNTANNYRYDAIKDSIYPLPSPMEFCLDGNLVLIADKNSIPANHMINTNMGTGDNPVLYMMQ